MNYNDCVSTFGKTLSLASGRYDSGSVFNDWATIFAISLQNSCWYRQRYEDEYKRIIAKYQPQEVERLQELCKITIDGLSTGFCDFLGDCFMRFGMGNNDKGQFFTPYHICTLLGDSTVSKELCDKTIKEKGFVTFMDCACGCSATLIAGAESFRKAGYNPQTEMFVYANDIDRRCVMCSYIQLSLLGIPALLTVGNALTLENYEVFKTPLYLMQWLKFRKVMESDDSKEEIKPEAIKEFAEQKGQLVLF